jgi:CelD/BcsL family acetyltransferase involved in cellulose biosynthesis
VGLPVHQALRPDDVEAIADATAPRGRRPSPELRVEPVADVRGLREEWNLLAEQSRNVFSTWDFASVWWRHFGGAGSLQVHAVRDRDGRLLAVLPLYDSVVRGMPMLAFLGHGVADQLGPVCGARGRPAAAEGLKRLLRSGSGAWQLLLSHRVAADEAWDALLGGQVLKREASPVLDIAGRGWEDFLRSCSPNLRGQLRGRERKLAREHELRFRLVREPAELDVAFERLVSLHDARWEGASSAFAQGRRAFHREFAAAALRRGWLRLWLAELDGAVAAAWYGFRFAGVESYYQSGRAPDLDRTNVGFVLLAHTMREAMADGQAEYRFLRGPEPYKQRFATRDAPVDTVVLARGPVGAAVVAATRAAVRLPLARRAVTNAAG